MVINRIASAFELLRKTPAGKQALEEHQREIATEREDHVAAIGAAQAKLHGALPKLDETISKTQAQLDRAHKALETAEGTHRAALQARGNAVHRAEHMRRTHQDELAKGSDPRIPGVCAKLRLVYLKESTGRLLVEYEETGKFEAMSRHPNPVMRISDNRKARLRRMTATREAIKAIDDLRFDARADVGEEMQAIIQGIPDGSLCEFFCEGFAKHLHGQNVVDIYGLYKPIDVREEFVEVLEPAGFASRDNDGGSGGTGSSGADFPEGVPSGIPMAR